MPIAALILTALAIPAAAQQQVPFKGTFQGYDTVALPTITTTATGIGTLVGQLSLTDVLILTSACCGTGTGKKKIPPELSEYFSQMGRKGGKIGGKRSLETMTPEQRVERAKKASAKAAAARKAKRTK